MYHGSNNEEWDVEPNGDHGYSALDIIKDASHHNGAFDSYDNKAQANGYYAMDILAKQMPGLYSDHGQSGWFNMDIVASLTPEPADPETMGFGLGIGMGMGTGTGSGSGSGEGEGEESLNDAEYYGPAENYQSALDIIAREWPGYAAATEYSPKPQPGQG